MLNNDNKVAIHILERNGRKNYNSHRRVSSLDLLYLKQPQFYEFNVISLCKGECFYQNCVTLREHLHEVTVQTKLRMQTLPLTISVSAHHGICLSIVTSKANIYHKKQ